MEVIAFFLAILIIWLNEIVDIPHLLFNTGPTPVNWVESILESAMIILLGGATIFFTCKFFKKMKYLEGMLPICSLCKKVRDSKGYWEQVDQYIRNHADVEFTHILCEECAEKFYSQEDWYQKMKTNEKEK